MSNIKRIKKLILNIAEDDTDFKDFLKSQLKSTVGNIAGGVVTGLARASGIPMLAGVGDLAGKSIKNKIDKLLQNKNDLKNKVDSNYYFYKDSYNNFQTGNYGYDIDLPKDKFNPNELIKIRKLIYPSFKRFGYNCKFIEKRNDSGEYLFILFRGNSKIPLRDNKVNPIIFPFPFDIFNSLDTNEDSDVSVYELLKIFNIPISYI